MVREVKYKKGAAAMVQRYAVGEGYFLVKIISRFQFHVVYCPALYDLIPDLDGRRLWLQQRGPQEGVIKKQGFITCKESMQLARLLEILEWFDL